MPSIFVKCRHIVLLPCYARLQGEGGTQVLEEEKQQIYKNSRLQLLFTTPFKNLGRDLFFAFIFLPVHSHISLPCFEHSVPLIFGAASKV